jgi:preprotein translocase subunit YajC
MSKQNNQIVEGSTFIIILVIINGLFLFLVGRPSHIQQTCQNWNLLQSSNIYES